MICKPKFVALDTSTLGSIAKDYWSGDVRKRANANAVIDELQAAGIYVVLSYTHLCELLRHDDVGVAEERIAWLRMLPMVAWIRPYRDHWWVGGMADIALRELTAIVHDFAKDWSDILNRVQPELLETGVGSDMFVDRPQLWSLVRSRARQNLEKQIYVASLSRADWADAYSSKYKDFTQAEEMPEFGTPKDIQQATRVAHAIEGSLKAHGDKRICAPDAAKHFVNDLVKDLGKIGIIGGNPYHAVLGYFGVPLDMVGPNTTIGQIGEIAVHVAHLKLLASGLNPPIQVSVLDVPPNSLPSFTLERELLREQHGADRVNGSDLGDCHILPLAFYVDAVEVDKRTLDHVRKIRKRNSRVANHFGGVFRSSSYSEVPTQLSGLGLI